MVGIVRSANKRRKWAIGVLKRCKSRSLDVNHPDAVSASKIVGFTEALAIVTGDRPSSMRPWQDAMNFRVSGSFGSRQ